MTLTDIIRKVFPCYGREHDMRYIERHKCDGVVGWTEAGVACRRCGSWAKDEVILILESHPVPKKAPHIPRR